MKVYMDAIGEMPQGVAIVREGDLTRLYFDYEDSEYEVDGEVRQQRTAENADVLGALTYGSVVSAIVNGKYTNDDVQAILSNKALADDAGSGITDGKRSEYVSDYNAFQAWRQRAKEIATEVIGANG